MANSNRFPNGRSDINHVLNQAASYSDDPHVIGLVDVITMLLNRVEMLEESATRIPNIADIKVGETLPPRDVKVNKGYEEWRKQQSDMSEWGAYSDEEVVKLMRIAWPGTAEVLRPNGRGGGTLDYIPTRWLGDV